jgi:septum formation protein
LLGYGHDTEDDEKPMLDIQEEILSEMGLRRKAKLILASKSPRRRDLLEERGIDFEILAIDVDEDLDETLPPAEYVTVIAERKADAALKDCLNRGLNNAVIAAADTIVYIDGQILGKPDGRDDAFRMLKLLNNNWHSVFTGLRVVFIRGGNVTYKDNYCETRVKFNDLTDKQIREYIDEHNPYDKAGSYAIQQDNGFLVREIIGDYNNVVGLPVDMMVEMITSTA